MTQKFTAKAVGRASHIVPSIQRVWMHADAAALNFQFVGLSARGRGVGPDVETACDHIRHVRPRQVMLETCDGRRDLIMRAVNASSGSSETAGGPPSHTDVVNALHGGLPGAAVVSLVGAAEDVGAKVYAVDRHYRATQNRVARYLVSNPHELL